MTSDFVPSYSHKQTSPLCFALYVPAFILIITAISLQKYPDSLIVGVVAIPLILLAPAFHYLKVGDEGEHLSVRFGPMPLFATKVDYSSIQKVEIGRTLLLDGWGIHMSVRGGWVWNLWGRDCVVVHLRKGVLRIGTDDAENLARFLEGKIGG